MLMPFHLSPCLSSKLLEQISVNLVLRIYTKLCWLNLILVLNSPMLIVVNIEFQLNFTDFLETSLLYKTFTYTCINY